MTSSHTEKCRQCSEGTVECDYCGAQYHNVPPATKLMTVTEDLTRFGPNEPAMAFALQLAILCDHKKLEIDDTQIATATCINFVVNAVGAGMSPEGILEAVKDVVDKNYDVYRERMAMNAPH